MGCDDLRQENAALRERIAALSDAVLRVSASLDLDTVLREIVDRACALTAARYGMIATVHQGGEIEEFIAPDCRTTSAGTWAGGRTGRRSSSTCATFRGPCAWPTFRGTSARAATPPSSR